MITVVDLRRQLDEQAARLDAHRLALAGLSQEVAEMRRAMAEVMDEVRSLRAVIQPGWPPAREKN